MKPIKMHVQLLTDQAGRTGHTVVMAFNPFSSTTFWKVNEKIPTVTNFLCFQLLRYIALKENH